MSFFGGTPWVFCIHFSLTRNWDHIEGRFGRLPEYRSSSWSGKRNVCLSSSFLSGFCEVRRKVQPQGQAGFECGDSEQFQALVEESGLLLFPHVCLPLSCPLHWKEAIVLFSSAHILMTWLTEPSRRKCKWPTWAYVQDSLLKPRGGIYFQSNLLVAPPEGDE